MCVNNDTNGIAQKSEQCEQQKNRFIFTSYSCTEHTRRQRWCALIPVKTEWYLETGRNEARNYVYVISNRRLKTNWGQHWDAVWRWLNRFLTVFERKWNVWNFCGRHSHTQRERERECVYVKLLLYVRTWAWNFLYGKHERTNEQTNRRTNQFSIMFLFVVVIFLLLFHSVFRWCFVGAEMEKIDMHAHGIYGVCVYVWVCDRTSTSAQRRKKSIIWIVVSQGLDVFWFRIKPQSKQNNHIVHTWHGHGV